MPFEKDPSEIGAAWIHTGSKGEWLSGTINGVPFVAFRNNRKKEGSKMPDWIVKRPMKKEVATAPDPYFSAQTRQPGEDDGF